MDGSVVLRGLTKIYGQGSQARVVLDSVQATFVAGEVIAVRGRSGSGKSTLLNLLAGLDTPSAGEVVIDGVSLHALSERERTSFRRDRIGIVFQFFNLIPTLTVLENVVLPAELAGTDFAQSQSMGRELLEEVGLADRAREFPDRLSGGEQQRIAIARALVCQPELVLADEPTGNLDRATGEDVLALLDRMTRARGRTLVLVTHSHPIAAVADRVLTIEEGKLTPARAAESDRAAERSQA